MQSRAAVEALDIEEKRAEREQQMQARAAADASDIEEKHAE